MREDTLRSVRVDTGVGGGVASGASGAHHDRERGGRERERGRAQELVRAPSQNPSAAAVSHRGQFVPQGRPQVHSAHLQVHGQSRHRLHHDLARLGNHLFGHYFVHSSEDRSLFSRDVKFTLLYIVRSFFFIFFVIF